MERTSGTDLVIFPPVSRSAAGRRAAAAMRPHRGPQRDVRDMANLSARLLDLSFTLAKFLRDHVLDQSLCADDGWMALNDVLPHVGGYTREDVEIEVRESFSKD